MRTKQIDGKMMARSLERVLFLRYPTGFRWASQLRKPKATQTLPITDVIDLLRVYKQQMGHLMVPIKFVVPAEPSWPSHGHGYKLGRRVKDMRQRHGHFSESQLQTLNDLGFVWNTRMAKFLQAKAALEHYKQLFGDVEVPQHFVVPKEAQWPEGLWGYRLGTVCDNIRHGRSFEDHQAVFEAMGFRFTCTPHSVITFKDLKTALITYHKLYGNYDVPHGFVIDSEDTSFPASVRGIKLGIVLYHVRTMKTFRQHHEELAAMGVNLAQKQDNTIDVIREAYQMYKTLHGHSDVPPSFTIHYGSKDFPSHLWGIALGPMVTRIRRGMTHKAHRSEFES